MSLVLTSPSSLARTAFEEGIKIFSQVIANDVDKKHMSQEVLESTTFADIIETVKNAKCEFEEKYESSRMCRDLVSLSGSFRHYGKVMDSLKSHDPEYITLVWGAMRFLLEILTKDEEKTAGAIITGLCEISDSLASIEIAVAFYPPDMMQDVLFLLYAHITRFLIRALEYYEESRLCQAMQPVRRPPTLYYNDLISNIRRDIDTATTTAMSRNQSELRTLHKKFDEFCVQFGDHFMRSQDQYENTQDQIQCIADKVQDIRQVVEFEKVTRASNRIQTPSGLSETQLHQALTIVSSQCIIDHRASLHTAVQLQKTRLFYGKLRQESGRQFWASAKLHEWNQSQTSSAILLKSTIRDKTLVRGFCTEVIEYLASASVTVLWIFPVKGQQYSLLDALKSLVFQALSLGSSQHYESKMTFRLNQFMDARIEDDYLNILGGLLECSKLIYIITVTDALLADDRARYRSCLHRLSRVLIANDSKAIVKVINTTYGPERMQEKVEDYVLAIGNTDRGPSRRQGASRLKRSGKQFKRKFIGGALR